MKPIIKILFCLVASVLIGKPMLGTSTNYVTLCDANGRFKTGDQFGGQLLNIVSLLAYAWDHDLVPYFPKDFLLRTKGASINYPYVFNRLNQELPDHVDKSMPLHISDLDYSLYPGRNVCLCAAGIYPYAHHRDRLREYFAPTDTVKRYLNQKYEQIFNHPKTVAVHVRTYHPNINNTLFFLGREYFQSAMNHFTDDHLFVIFSDRIEWAKQYLAGAKPNMIFIHEENHILEFYLMTYCLNHIISNSNYSFMAAFLKNNPAGATLGPEIWLCNTKPEMYFGMYFPGCITLPVGASHPADWNLLRYSTTSIDEGGPKY
ncbi:MAG: alpha-1,2-fucosyltransferase [Verrucomicrobia bacterium]|nr:alpha-1,2-fucosyltransferase [Verrucomicrobiota bacterium]